MKLTDSRIKNLKPKPKRYIVWEPSGTGLGVRVSPHGRKSFVYMYRFNGRARMMTIGPYSPRLGLVEARLKASESRAILEGGEDPGSLHVEGRRKERQADTLNELAHKYLERWAKPRKRSAHEDERILNKEILGVWGERRAKDIRRRDIIELLDSIVDRGSPVQANRVLTVLKKMFYFAVSRDILGASPCVAVERPTAEKSRDRVLSESEIRTLWEKLECAKMSQGSRLALKMMLMTAQRRGEVLSAEWGEIDLDNRLWTIPASKSKNRVAHTVPLSPQALGLLEEVKALAGVSRWLFPSPRSKEEPVTVRSLSHAVRKNLAMFGLEQFTPHDLRRSVATHMAAIGVSRLVIGQVLNHKENSVTAIYDRHGYDKEKRQALERWCRKLDSIITGAGKQADVIPLAGR